jgi:hypothetical protein
VVPSGVIARPIGCVLTSMFVGSLVRVATSIAETKSSPKFVTNAVAPSGVIATLDGCENPVMSTGSFVVVAASMVDTEPAVPGMGNAPS